jgi:hypothetical protein
MAGIRGVNTTAADQARLALEQARKLALEQASKGALRTATVQTDGQVLPSTGTSIYAPRAVTTGPGPEPPPQTLEDARRRVARDYGEAGLAEFDRLYYRDLNQEYGPGLDHVPSQYQASLINHVAVHAYYEFEALMRASASRGNPAAWGTTGDPNAAQLEGLKEGDRGDTVLQLQNDLVGAGYMLSSVVAAGNSNFGDITDAALRQFQLENGIPVTGVVDAATVAALEHPRARPHVPANGPALEHQAELGLTTGPLQRLADGSVYQPFENGYVYVNSDNLRVVRTFDAQDIAPPERIGVFTSVAAATKYYLSQWGESPSYQDDNPDAYDPNYAPDHYDDCGPTSGVIALSALGIVPHPRPTRASEAIANFRTDTGVAYQWNADEGRWEGTMSLGAVEAGIEANGGVGSQIGTTLEDVNAALGRGHPVILGSEAEWAAWGRSIDTADPNNYLNHNTGDPGGHIVTVLGMTPQGDYIVADPLMRNGCITATPEQMQVFLNQAFNYGAMEVSRPAN